ncbi:MAG: hypothetical protein D6731_02035 [Planctomycetota bacterium]|nr:MAG: hypothetical protein D6731_02035 [Planctomycetota bacterium]
MARMSEEQKKDLKLKLALATVVVVVGGAGYLAGPGLEPVFLDYAREHKTEPWAPEWYYKCAKVMQWTFRPERAQEVFEEFYLTYGGHDWELDFEPVLEERHGDEDQAYYLPWVNAKFDGLPGIDEDDPDIKNRRPAPVSKEPHPLLGKVLYEIGFHFERERQYYQCDHIYSVLYHMWPEGSEAHQLAVAARKRRLLSSF